MGRDLRKRRPADAERLDRLARGRDRPRHVRTDLSRTRAGTMAALCQDRLRPGLRRHLAGWQARHGNPAERQACRAADQTHGSRCRHSVRSAREGPARPLLWTQPARRSRQFRGSRRTLCPEAARTRFGRDDPPLSTPPRPVPGEPDQGRRSIAISLRSLLRGRPETQVPVLSGGSAMRGSDARISPLPRSGVLRDASGFSKSTPWPAIARGLSLRASRSRSPMAPCPTTTVAHKAACWAP